MYAESRLPHEIKKETDECGFPRRERYCIDDDESQQNTSPSEYGGEEGTETEYTTQ